MLNDVKCSGNGDFWLVSAALNVSRAGRAQKLEQTDQQPVASSLVETASWNTSELELQGFFNLNLRAEKIKLGL